jgi:hypothetical protein
MMTDVRHGVTFYNGSNGNSFQIVRTLAPCLAGHMLLASCVKREARPDGTVAYEPTGEKRAIKRLVKYNLTHRIR